jgi:hypothetical protein
VVAERDVQALGPEVGHLVQRLAPVFYLGFEIRAAVGTLGVERDRVEVPQVAEVNDSVGPKPTPCGHRNGPRHLAVKRPVRVGQNENALRGERATYAAVEWRERFTFRFTIHRRRLSITNGQRCGLDIMFRRHDVWVRRGPEAPIPQRGAYGLAAASERRADVRP